MSVFPNGYRRISTRMILSMILPVLLNRNVENAGDSYDLTISKDNEYQDVRKF